MREFSYPIREKQVDRPLAGQLVFQPTRSVLLGTPSLFPRGAGDDDAVIVEPFLWTVVDPANKWFDGEPDSPASINVTYEGEPLCAVGFQWVYPDEELLKQGDWIKTWICCRRRLAHENPSAEFFLELDLWALPGLMPSATETKRKALREVQETLETRVRYRGSGRSASSARIMNPERYRIVEEKMRELIDHHFQGDVRREVEACDRFAAGQLKQICPRPHKRLPGYWAGDVDSANVFLFAEFALAMVELGKKGELPKEVMEYWRHRVNMFARMQAIFLERWESKGQRRFECYDGTASPLTEIPRKIIAPYEEAGNNLDVLRCLIKGQIGRMDWK